MELETFRVPKVFGKRTDHPKPMSLVSFQQVALVVFHVFLVFSHALSTGARRLGRSASAFGHTMPGSSGLVDASSVRSEKAERAGWRHHLPHGGREEFGTSEAKSLGFWSLSKLLSFFVFLWEDLK